MRQLEVHPGEIVVVQQLAVRGDPGAREAGPAAATQAMSCLGCLKLRQSTGTGFAQPNTKPPGNSSINPGTRIVPIGSMCFKGFSVNRPSISAVRSPKWRAASPCAVSCTVMASSTGINQAAIC